MGMFDKFKEISAMKNMLSEMDRALKEKILDVESNGVTIKINAKSEILDLHISPDLLKQNQEKIEKTILATVQQAIKKSHDVMAEEGKKFAGGMKIPGLM